MEDEEISTFPAPPTPSTPTPPGFWGIKWDLFFPKQIIVKLFLSDDYYFKNKACNMGGNVTEKCSSIFKWKLYEYSAYANS